MISINRIKQDYFGGAIELDVQADYLDLCEMFPSGNIDPVKLLGPLAEKKQPKVERVIFNGPATIVFWDDGEKTVVKCRECESGCIFDKDFDENPFETIARNMMCGFKSDPEKAVMAAMLKRLYKNYQDVLRDAFEGGER